MKKLAFIKDFIPSFEEQCCKNKIPYSSKGVTNVEACIQWALVGHFKPDVILESGVYQGRSSEILAKAQEYFNIKEHLAFELESVYEKEVRKRLEKYKTIYKIQSSIKGFEDYLNKNPEAKVLCIIDGPKTGKPFKKLLKIASRFNNLCAIFSHDCYPKSTTGRTFSACKDIWLKDKELIITNPEFTKDMQYLNDYIKPEVNEQIEKSDTFNYVGICL
jgi:hypothetical protein